MERDDRPTELHTLADDERPLEPAEAELMGRQAVHETRGESVNRMVIYGEADEGFENEDQADAHHAEPGEHL